MEYKRVDTGGIINFRPLEGCEWYWGMDYTDGDLYEAEELWQDGRRIKANRLLFIDRQTGETMEPVTAREGQYLGSPVCSGGSVYVLRADFPAGTIDILKCAPDLTAAEPMARLPRSGIKDCYNLMLTAEPLTLVRQGHDGDFQVLWPERGSFAIDAAETFDFREGDELIFARWFEDPDYREEVVVRRYPTGEVLERMDGSVITLPGGERWLVG